MKGIDEESRMQPFAEVKWHEFLPEGETPIPFLLEKDVPVYFCVDPVYHLVYRFYQHALTPAGEAEKVQVEDFVRVNGGDWGSVPDVALLPIEGFLDCDFAFLRLDRSSLEQIQLNRSCSTPRFTRGGLIAEPACPGLLVDPKGRPTRTVKERTRGAELIRVEFDEAVVVSKNEWEQEMRSERLTRPDPLGYVLQGQIKAGDLFLDAVDIARLKRDRRATIERVAYPFRHEERMPGLYWMFQAAYTLNDLADLEGGEDGVKVWLKRWAPDKTYRYRSMRTAEKFVWRDVDRNQGGDRRDPFDLDGINKLRGDGARSRYKLSFTSDGLAMILAIADSWYEIVENRPRAPVVDLAMMLMENGFAGLEVGDLVYLIGGERVDLNVESDLKKWVAKRDQEAREEGKKEMGWRPVFEQDSRDKMRKKRARNETVSERMARERKGAN